MHSQKHGGFVSRQFYCADLIDECGLRGRVSGGHGVVLWARHLARVGRHPVVPRQHPRQEVLPDHELQKDDNYIS